MTDLKMEVYSPALELLGFLEIHNSVIWTEKAFAAGSFSVEALITPETLALLQPENIIWIEGDTAGIIEYVDESADKDGPYITVKGYTLTGILDRRILWGRYDMSGTPPEIMHSLVNDCCINPTRGNIEARKIPGLVLLDAPAGGESVRIQRTGSNLLDTLGELGETYGVAFGVRFNAEIPRMEFWTRWGRNLTVHQSDKPQVFYSTELDDVLESEYTYNSQDYRNVSLIGGEGEGNDRVYVTVEEDIEETPDTPVNPPTPPEPQKYTVALLVDPEGGGTASGGKTVAAGVSVTVTAVPSAGYTFSGWRENGNIVSTSASYTFTVNSDRTLTAVFAASIPVYTVTATIDPAGSGTVTGAGQYQESAQATITATPGEGYTFSGWKEGGVTVSESVTYTFTITGNRALVATFEEVPQSRLPAGYMELEYIQCDSSQYIDTGVKITATSKVVMDVQPTSWPTTTTGNNYFFSASYSPTSGYKYEFRMYASKSGIGAQSGRSSTTSGFPTAVTISSSTALRRMTLQLDAVSKTGAVDGTSVAVGNSTFSASMSTLRLLGTANPNTAAYRISARLYSCQVYSGDALIRDFVPCTDPSGTVGLYDLANDVFYGPAIGTLAAGPAV